MKLKRILFIMWGSIMLTLSSYAAQEVQLIINVIAPAVTPKDAQLFIAGNHHNAGNWNPSRIRLEKRAESQWTVMLKLPKGFLFEFKITRGSWSNEAIYIKGEIPKNNRFVIATDTTITLHPLTWRDLVSGFNTGIVGTVKYHREIYGEGLNYPRDIIVWLPPSYEKSTLRNHPVLYMQDGQNIIDPATSFIGYDWHVDEVADSLIHAKMMKEIIIVGIYNTPDRIAEYDNTKLGRAYMKFIIERVKPLIDSTYRTLEDRDNTAVMGSSMGGLISFLLVWNYPEVFSQVSCISPVFPSALTRMIENTKSSDKTIRIYLDNGGVGLDKELQPGCENILRSLKNIGFTVGENLEWFRDLEAEHDERGWAKRVWRPLLFMFGNR